MTTEPSEVTENDQASESAAPAVTTPAAAESGISVATRPSMPEEVIAHFRSRLEAATTYLEYGSGGSTRMAVRLNVPRIYSVESSAAFGKEVRRRVSWDRKETVFKMIVPPFGETGAWGYPRPESYKSWGAYVNRVWDVAEAEGASPDLVLIDGRFRVACFLMTWLRAKPGTIVLFDDFTDRIDRYGVALQFGKPIKEIARMAEFVVPETMDMKAIAIQLALAVTDPR